jgi:hypothetical protein
MICRSNMSKHSTIVYGKEGQAHISTKSRWMGLVPMPHTGVLPYPCSAGEIKRLGIFIKWTSNDPVVLEKLHDSIARLVREIGVSGLAEIRDSARMTEGVWKTFGGKGCGLQQAVEMAAQDGVVFPLPADVLIYVKGFQ